MPVPVEKKEAEGKKEMSKRKLRPGPHITSTDEVAGQEFIFFHGKVYHWGWFCSWPLKMLRNCVGLKGCIQYAMPIGEKTRFSDEEILMVAKRLHGNTSRAAMEHALMILNVWDNGVLNAGEVIDRYEDAALR